MVKTRKRKAATVAGVSVLTAALLLGGTFAWQSISQMALNENRASVNPGARLHDDYSGNYSKSGAKTVTDVGVKRVYVENFTDEEDKVAIIARVRLDEYMEIGASAGYKNTTVTAYENTVISKLDTDGLAHGIVEVEEDTSVSGQVTLKVTPVPYTGYTVKSVKVDSSTDVTSSMSGGVYTHAAQMITDGKITPVTIEVEFETDNGTPYAYDTIEPAKSLVEKDTNGDAVTVNDSGNWETYVPKVNASSGKLEENTASAFRNYVTLNFGWDSSYDTTGIYYMPTFNKDKDSLSADINGTYAGGTSGQPFGDYEEYTANQTVKAYASYDDDENDVDDGKVYKKEETHTAAAIEKTKSNVISMKQWKDDYGMQPGNYWVYDTDGWAYWANLLEPEDVTGLLLSRNEMTGTPEDNWYYAMNVVGQFVTPGDIGSTSNKVGFYAADAGANPSEDAEKLLKALTVLNESTVLSMESGDKDVDVTWLSDETMALHAASEAPVTTALLETSDGSWSVTDETVVELSLDSDTGKVTAKAKKPGSAYIVYISDDGEIAAVKAEVAYQIYTITAYAMHRLASDTMLQNVISVSDDNILTVKGYYTDAATNTYYQVAIGDKAFWDQKQILNLILEDGICSIGESAFYHCLNVQGTLEIPGSVNTIGRTAFWETGFDEILIHEGVQSIMASAFLRNSTPKTVKNLELPSTLRFIEKGVLYGCTVENMSFPNGNPVYCIKDLVLYKYENDPDNKTELVYYSGSKTDPSFQIPDTVEKICEQSFRTNKYIQKVTIPDSVTTIEHGAFMQCTDLNDLTISKNVSEISKGAFGGCTALTEFKIDVDNPYYKVVDGIIYDKAGTTLVAAPAGKIGEVEIPDGVTEIYGYAFMSASKITKVQIPESMETIPSTAFSGNTALTTIVYTGTKADWTACTALSENSVLNNVQNIICSDGVLQGNDGSLTE